MVGEDMFYSSFGKEDSPKVQSFRVLGCLKGTGRISPCPPPPEPLPPAGQGLPVPPHQTPPAPTGREGKPAVSPAPAPIARPVPAPVPSPARSPRPPGPSPAPLARPVPVAGQAEEPFQRRSSSSIACCVSPALLPLRSAGSQPELTAQGSKCSPFKSGRAEVGFTWISSVAKQGQCAF